MLYSAKSVLFDNVWESGFQLDIDNSGLITKVSSDVSIEESEFIDGSVVPGMPNIHSHAFQRAMVGMTEFGDDRNDNFWSWRSSMYQLAAKIEPEQLYFVASQLYMEMLEAGYTSVVEFHYLHHQNNGKKYTNPAQMSEAIIRAASDTGINLTLLPVLFMRADFDDNSLKKEQKRFHHSIDDYLDLLFTLSGSSNHPDIKTGIAFHSLRTVTKDAMQQILNSLDNSSSNTPVHIHIAEQEKEVRDCLAHEGARPVQWLFDHFSVNDNWCLIHATHVEPSELVSISSSACTVGLCPTTEANLGDGIFPVQEFLQLDGSIAIGSDSQTSINPMEELRWLEYGQRLIKRERNLAKSKDELHTGKSLWNSAVHGGAKAAGQSVNGIKPGNLANLIVLDDKHPALYGKKENFLLDSAIFASNSNPVKDVMARGKWLVKDGHHILSEKITRDFRKTITELIHQGSSDLI
jgi:formimidoylglutamate deiminase